MESLRAEEKRGVLWNFMDTSRPSNRSPPKVVNNTGTVLYFACACSVSRNKCHPLQLLLCGAVQSSYTRFAIMNEHLSVYSYDRTTSLDIPVCKCIKPYE